MNFDGFEFDDKTKQVLQTLDFHGRMPHAIVLESSDGKKSLELAKFISMYAVCGEANRPCGKCAQCFRASNQAHADIKYAYPEKKSKSYSIDQMRDIIKDAYIKPNEANAKVYVFEDAENRLAPVVQNAFLKLLEEPPQNVYFILLCTNSRKLLTTILSRTTVIRLKSKDVYSDVACQTAKRIVNGILSSREYDLLKALSLLLDKENASESLAVTKLLLRDGLAVGAGADALLDNELAGALARRFTRTQLMELIGACDSANIKLTQNININLLTTWLCGEYRRISWQR